MSRARTPPPPEYKPGREWLDGALRAARVPLHPVIGLGAAGTVAACAQAWCLARLLAGAVGGPFAGWGWAAAFAALAVARATLGAVSEDLAFAVGATARRGLRTELFTRLFRAGPDLWRHSPAGTLVTLAVDRIEGLDGLFARWAPAATLAVLSPAIVLAAAAWIDPWAAGILLLAGLLVPVGMGVAGIGAAAASRRQFAAMAGLQARFLDRVRGIATIVLAGRAEDEALGLKRAADELAARTMRVLRVAFLSSAALDGAAAAALIGLALRYFSAAPADPAVAIFMLLLAVEFFAPLRAFAAAYQERLGSSATADAFTLAPIPSADPARPPPRTVAALGVTVAFEHVAFTWDAARGPVLEDLSFRVPAHETLLLVGPSGAGKSTVIELLLGFIKPGAGRITLNGAPLDSIVPEALARMTSWIGQRPRLFAGSIRDNIRFGRPEATEAEIITAATAAGVTAFAGHLPGGLDTLIGEGGYGLSGGQAQRVAIARAFARNAPLLLLDEPTAHLDPATEADVFSALRRLAIGRTVVLASHSAAAHAFTGRRLELSAVPHAVQGAA